MSKQFMEFRQTLEDIDYRFAGNNEVSERERVLIAKALFLCEDNVIDDITENVWFVSPNGKYIAFQVNMKKLKKYNSIIFLGNLDKLPDRKAIEIILHEIGHHVLKHKSPSFDNLSNEDYKKQEKEAKAFAKERMNKKGE